MAKKIAFRCWIFVLLIILFVSTACGKPKDARPEFIQYIESCGTVTEKGYVLSCNSQLGETSFGEIEIGVNKENQLFFAKKDNDSYTEVVLTNAKECDVLYQYGEEYSVLLQGKIHNETFSNKNQYIFEFSATSIPFSEDNSKALLAASVHLLLSYTKYAIRDLDVDVELADLGFNCY